MTWWKDIDINLEKKHDGDVFDYTDEDAVKMSIKNIFLTNRGNRRRLPNFAFNLYDYLFEPIDKTTARNIGNALVQAIRTWDNRVIIEDLLITPQADKGQYHIVLKFKIKDIMSPDPYIIDEIIKAA